MVTSLACLAGTAASRVTLKFSPTPPTRRLNDGSGGFSAASGALVAGGPGSLDHTSAASWVDVDGDNDLVRPRFELSSVPLVRPCDAARLSTGSHLCRAQDLFLTAGILLDCPNPCSLVAGASQLCTHRIEARNQARDERV